MENVKNDTKKHHLYKKEVFSKTLVSVTQTEILHVESESQIDHHIRKIIVSNLIEMSDRNGTSSEDA